MDDKDFIDINSNEVTKRLVVIPRQFKVLEIHLYQYKLDIRWWIFKNNKTK